MSHDESFGAMPFSGNWATTLIDEAARDTTKDAKYVLQMLSTHPRAVEAVQEVLDFRNDPDYDPDQPGGDPATGVINSLVSVLTEEPAGS